ncbi:site-specific integrase [Phytobacter sp. RSE-02]|uniref:site-specific integrase n=1 Tax=Phytobacter sp. RSE-02 TaxID=3229229 RepID=UPI00339D4912
MNYNKKEVLEFDFFYQYSAEISKKVFFLNKLVKTDITRLLSGIDSDLQEGMIETLSYYAENFSTNYTKNIFQSLVYLSKNLKCKKVTAEFVWALLGIVNERNHFHFINLKSFFVKWYELGLFGVDEKAYSLLIQIRRKGKPAGEVVASMDPVKGPFTDTELQNISKMAKIAMEKGTFDKQYYLIIQLLITIGRRITQVLKLRAKDLYEHNGIKYLNIPRMKQRGHSKELYRKMEVGNDLWNQLANLKEENIGLIKDKEFTNDISSDYANTPLFICKKNLIAIDSLDSICDMAFNKATVTNSLKKFVIDNNVISERTNDFIKINPNRFRYTFATKLAYMGLSVEEIAEALDHSSINCVRIYVKNLPDHVEIIDKAVTPYLIDIADVFMGKRKFTGNILVNSLIPDSFKENINKTSNSPCEGCKRLNKWR